MAPRPPLVTGTGSGSRRPLSPRPGRLARSTPLDQGRGERSALRSAAAHGDRARQLGGRRHHSGGPARCSCRQDRTARCRVDAGRRGWTEKQEGKVKRGFAAGPVASAESGRIRNATAFRRWRAATGAARGCGARPWWPRAARAAVAAGTPPARSRARPAHRPPRCAY